MRSRTCARVRSAECGTTTAGMAAKAGMSAHHTMSTAGRMHTGGCVSTTKPVAPGRGMAPSMLRPDRRQPQENNPRRHGTGAHHLDYSPCQAVFAATFSPHLLALP